MRAATRERMISIMAEAGPMVDDFLDAPMPKTQ
jgi:hypothetical protein